MRRADIKASESRTVFVGNAPVKTQNRELRKLFKFVFWFFLIFWLDVVMV